MDDKSAPPKEPAELREVVPPSLDTGTGSTLISSFEPASPVPLDPQPPPPTDSLPPRYRAPPGTNAVVPVIEPGPPRPPPTKKQRKPVDVYLTGGSSNGGAAYIWSAVDAIRLRNEFRLLGDLVGTLPKHTAQNQFLTVPLVLSYDELHFGATRGFLRMLRDDAALDYNPPTPQEVRQYYKERDEEREKYADEVIANQERQCEKRKANGNEKKVTGRKRKRDDDLVPMKTEAEERPAKISRSEGFFGRVMGLVLDTLTYFVPQFLRTETDEIESKSDTALVEEEEVKSEEEGETEPSPAEIKKQAEMVLARRRQQAMQAAAVQTACVAVDRNDYAEVVSAVVPKDISPERLLARQLVFADLYDKGYAMSCGAKFGADYLAYAGDPALFHASLAVIVMNATEQVSMRDVVALGRLGDSTKKRTALAYVEGDPTRKYEVRYVGVQWEETLP